MSLFDLIFTHMFFVSFTIGSFLEEGDVLHMLQVQVQVACFFGGGCHLRFQFKFNTAGISMNTDEEIRLTT